MANFRKGPQTVVINSASRYAMLFYANQGTAEKPVYNIIETGDVFTFGSGTASTATLVTEGADYTPDADGTMTDPDAGGAGTAIVAANIGMVKIASYVDLFKGRIKNVVGAKGIASQKHKVGAGFALNGTVPDTGTELTLTVTLKSRRKPADLASWKSNYTLDKTYTVIYAGQTADQLAAVFAVEINKRGFFGGGTEGLLDLKAVVNTGEAPDRLEIEAPEDSIELVLAFTGAPFTLGSGVAKGITATIVNVTAFYEGRNTARQLREGNISSVNDSRVGAYENQMADLPVDGKLYSHYRLAFDVARPDLGGGDASNQTLSGEFQFDVYINEDLSSYITAFVAWLNATGVVSGTKTMYTGTTLGNVDVTSATLA